MVQSLRSFVPLRMVREKERSDGWPRRAPASCQAQRGGVVISARGIENDDDRQRAVGSGLPQGTSTCCTHRALQCFKQKGYRGI